MRYLDQDTIHELHQTAVELNLHDRRDQLLAGLSNQYISQILNSNNASGQLLNDLNQMNSTPYITDNVVPLYRWLRNAAYAVSYRADMQSYFRNYAERVMDQYLSDYSPQKSANAKARPERILFVNDLLPFGFLRGAERAGAATARLTVPAFSGHQPINFPSTTTHKNYYATGWLIGPRHLITNHHVINARGVDEPDARLDDFSFQAQRTVAEFDYDQRDVPGHAVKAPEPSSAEQCNRMIRNEFLRFELAARPPTRTFPGFLPFSDLTGRRVGPAGYSLQIVFFRFTQQMLP
ncbi:hypothetical protein ACCS66_35510 [Rhizobium ruizarguesonis]